MVNKCFAIIAEKYIEDSLLYVVDALSDQIKETPLFVQLINEEDEKNLLTETLDIKSPIFQTTRSTAIFTVKCSKQTEKPIKLAWSMIKQTNFHDLCSDTQTVLKVAFNKEAPFFDMADSKIDIDTVEGVFVDTFLEKNGLVAEWHDANFSWGSKDPNGTWNGVVGMVGYKTCDVGITYIGYTEERGSFIDFSHPAGDTGMSWISKTPQKLPPATNIIRIFDKTSWLLIFISMLATSLMLLIASRAGLSYGVGTSDITSILLTPFQTLNAESLPGWFSRRATRGILSPGFTGNYLLLMWTVMGSLISMAFLCNIRAMLMKPVFQKPIDSTEDILTVGKIPINDVESSFWPEYLKTSSNKWERLAGETGYSVKSIAERNRALVEKVYEADTHVYLASPVQSLTFLNLKYFKHKDRPIFHISRERLR